MTTNTEHEHRVLGGLKSTLHNPNTSAEAKERAAHVLVGHGVELSDADKAAGKITPAPEIEEFDPSKWTAHEKHVIAGYKSTVSNPYASEKAKRHALEELYNRGVVPVVDESETEDVKPQIVKEEPADSKQ